MSTLSEEKTRFHQHALVGSERRYMAMATPEASEVVAEAMSDEFSRRIIASTILEAKSIEQISSESGIALSTAYRRMRDLTERGLVLVDRIVVTKSGKRHSKYRSAFSDVKMDMQSGRLTVHVIPNVEVARKVFDRWQSVLLA